MKNLFLILALLPSLAFADSESDFKKYDLEMNTIYKSLLNKIDDQNQKQKLVDNQKNWSLYSRGYCSFYDGNPMIEQTKDCLIPFIKSRTKELKSTICKNSDPDFLYCLIID